MCESNYEQCGPGSVVGIATGYGLDGPEIESRWGGRDSPHLSRPALSPERRLVSQQKAVFREVSLIKWFSVARHLI